MAQSTPRVSNGLLVYEDEAQLVTLQVGSDRWRRWLDDAHTTTFRVSHALGAFTARKEHRRRGGAYWYAYRKHDGRLHKSYIGRASDLTLQRLDEVATRLHGEEPAPTGEPAPTPQDQHTQRNAVAMEQHTLGEPTVAPNDHRTTGGLPAAPVTEPPPDALLATKLFMPLPRHDLVRRPRLTERLSAALRGPLTLIIAPAGFGKTTLLSDWRAASPPMAYSDDFLQPVDTDRTGAHDALWPLAWLALDAGDNDLARFLRYVVVALRTVGADVGLSVLASLRSPQPPPAEAMLTLLLNDLATLPDDVILVLDDYHVIDDPTVHRAFAFLLDHIPPHAHLVITSRAEPPLPLARLRAGGRLTELNATDLQFTADEAATFLNRTMGLRLSAEDVARLEACTEGWIAGLQLAALSLQGRDPVDLSRAIAASTGAHRYILDYLADEVFDRQPDDLRRFLLRTSIPDRLNGALCDALVDEPDHPFAAGEGRAMLERLDAANLFLVPLDATRTWYRYHHLFAGFLRERVRREHHQMLPDLNRRACRWFEGQGLLTEAADHAIAAHDDAVAARLVEQALPTLLWQRGEVATLLRWLENMPRDVARLRPRLSLDLAWVMLWSTRIDAVEPRLRDAELALESALPPSGLDPHIWARAMHGEIASIRAELARRRGDLAGAIVLARQALDDLPADDRRVRGVTTGLLAGAYLWSGDAAAASRAYGDAVALSRTVSTMTLALIAGGRLVLSQALEGRLRQAAATYQEIRDMAASHGMLETPAIGVAQVGMGEVWREWNDLDAAERLVRQGIAHCTESPGQAEMAMDGYLTLARVLQARGHPDDAVVIVRQAEVYGRDGRVAQYAERVAVARARLWLRSTRDDLAAAMDWAGAREDAWRADERPGYLGLLERLVVARLHIMRGRRDDAAALLRRLLGFAEAGGLLGCVIEILALQARLFLEQGNVAQAMIGLTRALSLAEPERYVRPFVEEGAPMVALLRHARARGVSPAYVNTLLAACDVGPQGASPAASLAVDSLSARERELLRLLAAGLSTTEIAEELVITAGTVRNHLKNISGKLDVHSRLQAVERARVLNLL